MNVDDQIQALQDDDFQTGWTIFNNVRTKRAVSRAQLLSARNIIAAQLVELERNKQAAIIARKETEAIDASFKLRSELALAVHTLEVASKKAEQFLIEDAARHGMTVPNWQQILIFESSERIRVANQLELESGQAAIHIGKEHHLSGIRLREENDRHRREQLGLDRDMERRTIEHHILSQIDTRRHRELQEIDAEADWQQTQRSMDAADRIELTDVHQINLLTTGLIELRRLRYQMAYSDEPDEVKYAALKRYDKNIEAWEAHIDARQARLLPPQNGKETLRLKEGNPYRRAISSEEIEATEE